MSWTKTAMDCFKLEQSSATFDGAPYVKTDPRRLWITAR